MAWMVMATVVLAASPAAAGPAFARSMNNVMGSMPSPAGNPPAIVGLGVMGSSGECFQAANARPDATSWTCKKPRPPTRFDPPPCATLRWLTRPGPHHRPPRFHTLPSSGVPGHNSAIDHSTCHLQ